MEHYYTPFIERKLNASCRCFNYTYASSKGITFGAYARLGRSLIVGASQIVVDLAALESLPCALTITLINENVIASTFDLLTIKF